MSFRGCAPSISLFIIITACEWDPNSKAIIRNSRAGRANKLCSLALDEKRFGELITTALGTFVCALDELIELFLFSRFGLLAP